MLTLTILSSSKHLISCLCQYASKRLRKNTKTVLIGDSNNHPQSIRVDDLDLKVMASLVAGKNNMEISTSLKVPLSTIQRRTRRLFEKKAVRAIVEPNFVILGMRKGVVHLYINNMDAKVVSQKLGEIAGVTRVSIHIGNSDVVGDVVYRDSNEVLNIIASCKRIEGVMKVVWSEEVYSSVPDLSEKRMLSYFKAG